MGAVVDSPIVPPPGLTPVEAYGAFACGLLFFLWVVFDASRFRSRKPGKSEPSPLPDLDWVLLEEQAENSVAKVIGELPEDIQAEATAVPCLFHKWAQEHGKRKTVLGLYKGFRPGVVSDQGGPIVLFLGNIHDYCSRHALQFEDQVRHTYLHELGHHLGWDEVDLKRRGLQ